MIQLKQLERCPAGAGGPTPQHKFCCSYWGKAGAALVRGFPGLHTGAREGKNKDLPENTRTWKIRHSFLIFFYFLFLLNPENGVANT